MELGNTKIAVVGLGYVGLPLAVEFSKKFPTIGFDIYQERVKELNSGKDTKLEVSDENLQNVLKNHNLKLTYDVADISSSNVYIITVPTPTDIYNKPNLIPLKKASQIIGKIIKKGDVIIYESTVYPGATEHDCVPVIEEFSNMKMNVDFFIGYSPERINPGDKNRTVTNIVKVTSGSTPEVAEYVDQLYKVIITAGTYKATSIKVAEASKIIENSQRDINIAFVNELSKIFNLMGIDTYDVLEAAKTKWNFLPFKPGLVGGHCIGVDPFYLVKKAQEVGYHPEIILAGRKLNDSMGQYIASEVIELMIKNGIRITNASVLILGITFKENCPDIRNSKSINIYSKLKEYGCKVDVIDSWANPSEVKEEFDIELLQQDNITNKKYNAFILAVSHDEFLTMDFEKLKKEKAVIYDTKGFLPKNIVDKRL